MEVESEGRAGELEDLQRTLNRYIERQKDFDLLQSRVRYDSHKRTRKLGWSHYFKGQTRIEQVV